MKGEYMREKEASSVHAIPADPLTRSCSLKCPHCNVASRLTRASRSLLGTANSASVGERERERERETSVANKRRDKRSREGGGRRGRDAGALLDSLSLHTHSSAFIIITSPLSLFSRCHLDDDQGSFRCRGQLRRANNKTTAAAAEARNRSLSCSLTGRRGSRMEEKEIA